ncbi:hypothetical protein [Haloferax elongans]|uniref:hypothetical protein n=1 Tax=Haloferax elongans TaxID=403191 RepID=UPI0012678183|nr:hypothetical protein [Haloferax elongans]
MSESVPDFKSRARECAHAAAAYRYCLGPTPQEHVAELDAKRRAYRQAARDAQSTVEVKGVIHA